MVSVLAAQILAGKQGMNHVEVHGVLEGIVHLASFANSKKILNMTREEETTVHVSLEKFKEKNVQVEVPEGEIRNLLHFNEYHV